jgi:RNA polymerase sigma-70 factor (ECF subfamily)
LFQVSFEQKSAQPGNPFGLMLETTRPTQSVDIADPALITELKDGSDDAWLAVYEAYYAKLQRYARGLLLSQDEADDIAASVFLRAYTRIGSYSDRGKPLLAWLYGIALNVIRERRRERRRDPASWEALSGSRMQPLIGPANGVNEHLDVRQALTKLTSQQREIVLLLHVAGFSVREIAAMTGKSERSIYYLDARALTRLRKHLSPT